MIVFEKITEGAIVPTRQSASAAGYDLHALEGDYIPIGERLLIGTGIKMSMPNGWCGFIKPRSGLACIKGIDVLAGVIDSDYRGELKVLLINLGNSQFEFKSGDRIAQLVPVYCNLEAKEGSVNATDRGPSGFGSTGL